MLDGLNDTDPQEGTETFGGARVGSLVAGLNDTDRSKRVLKRRGRLVLKCGRQLGLNDTDPQEGITETISAPA